MGAYAYKGRVGPILVGFRFSLLGLNRVECVEVRGAALNRGGKNH